MRLRRRLSDPVPVPDYLLNEIDLRDRLIRWLALPLGTNMPIFPVADIHGNPMPESVAMRDLYAVVVTGAGQCEIGGCDAPSEQGYRRCALHS